MKFYTTSKISDNIHETPEGYLVCVGVSIARVGEMVYGKGETPIEPDEEGKVLIHREEEEVFRPETLASFEGKAITITHPVDFVSPENWGRLAKGVIQNVRRGKDDQADDVVADLLITDSVAIGMVKSGLREVSCGYEAEYTQTGEGRGLQTKIIGNHLALVDQGRAGSAYAINDHKGKGPTMKMKDKIKAIFAKAQDEAMAIADEKEEKPAAKDEAAPEKKDDKKDEKAAASKDEGAYDELKKMVSDLGEKIAAMGGKAKDEEEESEGEEKEEKSEDEEAPAGSEMEDRIKALETSVAKILEMLQGEESEDEESEDADEEEESEDAMGGALVGDTASRIEILAPGLKSKAKDAKAQALKVAYATKDGKAVIESLTGGKAPNLKDAKRVETLFIAASELLKVQRTSELAGTKQTRDSGSSAASTGVKSAEDINALNAKFYASK